MDSDYKNDLCVAGIHIYCKLAPLWQGKGTTRIGNGSWSSCPKAGTIERFHSHDYDGLLVCGCIESAS